MALNQHFHQLVVPVQNVFVFDVRAMLEVLIGVTMKSISVNFVSDEMVEDVPNVVAPMQKKFVKSRSQKIHGQTSSEFNVEDVEVVVDEGESSIHGNREISIEYYGQGFEKNVVIETQGKTSF